MFSRGGSWSLQRRSQLPRRSFAMDRSYGPQGGPRLGGASPAPSARSQGFPKMLVDKYRCPGVRLPLRQPCSGGGGAAAAAACRSPTTLCLSSPPACSQTPSLDAACRSCNGHGHVNVCLCACCRLGEELGRGAFGQVRNPLRLGCSGCRLAALHKSRVGCCTLICTMSCCMAAALPNVRAWLLCRWGPGRHSSCLFSASVPF